jgi:hypothetical protein
MDYDRKVTQDRLQETLCKLQEFDSALVRLEKLEKQVAFLEQQMGQQKAKKEEEQRELLKTVPGQPSDAQINDCWERASTPTPIGKEAIPHGREHVPPTRSSGD